MLSVKRSLEHHLASPLTFVRLNSKLNLSDKSVGFRGQSLYRSKFNNSLNLVTCFIWLILEGSLTVHLPLIFYFYRAVHVRRRKQCLRTQSRAFWPAWIVKRFITEPINHVQMQISYSIQIKKGILCHYLTTRYLSNDKTPFSGEQSMPIWFQERLFWIWIMIASLKLVLIIARKTAIMFMTSTTRRVAIWWSIIFDEGKSFEAFECHWIWFSSLFNLACLSEWQLVPVFISNTCQNVNIFDSKAA